MKNFKSMVKIGLVAPFVFATGMANAATDFGLINIGESFGQTTATLAADASSFDNDYLFQLGGLVNVDGLFSNFLSVTDDGTEVTRSDNMIVSFSVDNAGTWDLLTSWNVAAGTGIDYNQNLGAGSYLLN